MLVLTRKQNESIKIGEEITIIRIDNNAVRIGIEAPEGITIKRDDVRKDIRIK